MYNKTCYAKNLGQMVNGACGYLWTVNKFKAPSSSSAKHCGVQMATTWSGKVPSHKGRYQAKVDCSNQAPDKLEIKNGGKIYNKTHNCGFIWANLREPDGSSHDKVAAFDCIDKWADPISKSTNTIKSNGYGLEYGVWGPYAGSAPHGTNRDEMILKWDTTGGTDEFWFQRTSC